MTRIRGTINDDVLYGTYGSDIIRTGAGNDYVGAYDESNDTIYGGAGDDRLYAAGGYDVIYGGNGNDQAIVEYGAAYGNPGNDLVISRDLAVGGRGDDSVTDGLRHGFGGLAHLFGDAPDIVKPGNDFIYTNLYYQQDVLMTGGNGNDTFVAQGVQDGVQAHVQIMDFHPGEDLIRADYGPYTSTGLFVQLDLSNNGVLDQTDTDLGAQFWHDDEGVSFLAGDDMVIVSSDTDQRIDHINASDWQFT